MKKMFLKLNTVEDVEEVSFIASCLDCKAYIQRAELVVDATSKMGILSLDLSKVICFISEHELPDIFINKLKKFSVEGD